MAGTTQPGWSEGLRAQVAMVQPVGTHTEADYQSVGGIVEGRSKRGGRGGSRYLFGGMAGSALTSTMLRKAPYRTVRCLMLRAGLWENPMSGISGGAAGNVYYGGTANPPATERAGPDKPPPTVARASALPDDRAGQDVARCLSREDEGGGACVITAIPPLD